MPKITRHGGLTVHTGGQVLLPAIATVVKGEPGPELVDLPEGAACPGSSSETSPVKPPPSDEPARRSRQRRARTTDGRSKSIGASGTAPTGTTSGPATGA